MARVAYITTDPAAARYLLRGQLSFMREHDIDVTLISSPGDDLQLVAEREQVAVMPVRMHREISPFSDIRSLFRLFLAIRRLRPDIVNAGTPKAGLLAMIAATIGGVRLRIYTLRGLRTETLHGLKRALVEGLERLTAFLAHRIIAVSPSLREEYVRRGLSRRDKLVVIGEGSSNGVDAARFRFDQVKRIEIRRRLEIPEDGFVAGFIGRLTRDKGIVELIDAFAALRERVTGARLLLIGSFEPGDPVPAATRARLASEPGVIRVDHVGDSAPYYSAMDVLVFPSFREGFPNVPLEAAAAGLPVAGFRATGTVDAVVHGETGLLVAVGDVTGLTEALQAYATDPVLRRGHGEAGRRRAETSFRSERLWQGLLCLYQSELAGRAGE